MNKLTFLIVAVAGVILGGYWYVVSRSQTDEQIFCTQEAKLCPDGSYVGRTGPNCEFAACPNTSDNGGGGQGILPYKSGVRGTVTRGPMCPVMREDMPCPDAPYATEVYLYRANSNTIFAQIKSGEDGTFQFNVPPGDYMINAKNDGISKICSPVSVSIGPDEMLSVNVSCDTGIR